MGQRAVIYCRVSNAHGARASDSACPSVNHVASVNGRILGEHTEIESGKNSDRPVLSEAMRQCRLTGVTLLIAKLDRLSRDAGFLIGLRDAGVEFIAADMPNANRLTVGIMALVAEQEREAISARTKAALVAAKARGGKLGGWRGGPKVAAHLGREARTAQADAYAVEVAPLVRSMQADGRSLRQIAARLTEEGIRTPRGGQWTAAGVSRIVTRCAD